jgi:hypothetical protein
MTEQLKVAVLLANLKVLRFFPDDPSVIWNLAAMVCQMATDEQQVEWLVNRMTSGLYNEWPGPAELRACFCSRFKPADGINAYSSVYLDGIPPSKPEPQKSLRSAPLPELPPGPDVEILANGHKNEVIPDPESKLMIAVLAETMPKMPRVKRGDSRFERRLEEILTAPQDRPELLSPAPQIITQADVDRAVQEHREAKARAELEASQ